jgi:hypothetical protein
MPNIQAHSVFVETSSTLQEKVPTVTSVLLHGIRRVGNSLRDETTIENKTTLRICEKLWLRISIEFIWEDDEPFDPTFNQVLKVLAPYSLFPRNIEDLLKVLTLSDAEIKSWKEQFSG